MAELAIDDLVRLLRECGDQDESVQRELGGDIVDVPFEELGFDSLGVFNTTTRIEREFGIELHYDAVVDAETPGSLLKLVNDRLGARA